MTPAALSTLRILQALDLSPAVLRKVSIRSDGRPCFSALTDSEFDTLAQEVRRRWPGYWPGYADPAQQGWDPPI